jgi:hypothetical protein
MSDEELAKIDPDSPTESELQVLHSHGLASKDSDGKLSITPTGRGKILAAKALKSIKDGPNPSKHDTGGYGH